MLSICTTWMLCLTPLGDTPQEPISQSDTIRVEGSVELSPSAADAAALWSARSDLQGELARRVDAAAPMVGPTWMPDLIARHLAAAWLSRQDPTRALVVVDRDRRVRDHGSFASYQTTLAVRHDERTLDQMFANLPRELRRRGTILGAVAGGSVALWGILAFLYGWLDRITRGYMPWRLRLTCGAMGLALPAVALFFV